MNSVHNSDTMNPENERDETTYHSFVLRIWKSGMGDLKGYILDPITDESFPLVDAPGEIKMDDSNECTASQRVWIEPIGRWLMLWNTESVEEDLE